jgi:hypothetical protein
MPNLIEIGLLVLKKIFFQHKYVFPYCGLSRPPGTIMWTNFNVHYVRKISSKYELSGPWQKIFLNDPTPILYFCDYLPFEEDLTVYLYNFEFPLPKNNLY